MRVIPVPDEILPEHPRKVWGPPPGFDITGAIRPAESIEIHEDGEQYHVFFIQVEDGDLQELKAAGDRFYLKFVGSIVVPFDVNTFTMEGYEELQEDAPSPDPTVRWSDVQQAALAGLRQHWMGFGDLSRDHAIAESVANGVMKMLIEKGIVEREV